MLIGKLERAILETLAYSDVFEYPLHIEELHQYLPVCVSMEQVGNTLKLLDGQVGEKDGFHFLAGREKIVDIRKRREAYSRKLFQQATAYGKILGALPFVRMVALTGSLAVLNSSQGADFDYMLVAASKRVWTARAFALALNRMTQLLGHTLCPNVIVAESALVWPSHDLYTAREFCQMMPITGGDVYTRLMEANAWVKEFLPNAKPHSALPQIKPSLIQRTLERPLRGNLGDRLERWEMRRKIARFSRQAGFGEETNFSAEMCQGNFDHHRRDTSESLKRKLDALGTNI